MKRTLITIVAAMLVATGVSAATIQIEADKANYLVGENIILTATVDVAAGETLGAFQSVFYEVEWNPGVASVANAGVILAQGTGTQLITAGPNVGGSALSHSTGTVSAPSDSACNLNGISCQFLTQTNAGFGTVTLDAQTLVATLILSADAVGDIELAAFDSNNDLGDIVEGPNFAAAQVVVPEPTTAALLGLGLLGLGFAGRRR